MTDLIGRHLSGRTRSKVLVLVVAAAFTLQLLGVNPAVSQSQVLTAFEASDDPGLDPFAAAWIDAPTVEMALTSQQLTWPFGGSSNLLEARALHRDGMLYIRMSWDDATRDGRTLQVDHFSDAAAVEFPARAASSVPSICMGQTDGGVNIWQWRAGNEDGLPDSVEDLSPTGYVDRYPSTEELYFPAREAGNPVAQSHPVQNLVSVGFGSLSPAADQDVKGAAEWANGRWSVVFARELSHHAAEQVSLGEGASSDIAFAVWNGSEGERNGIKSVSQFVVLEVASGGAPRSTAAWLTIMFGSLLAMISVVVLLGSAMDRSVSRSIRELQTDPEPEPT